MKEFKVIKVGEQYYICGSKYFIAEPDAVPGVHTHSDDIIIIAKDYNQAQLTLVAELSRLKFYD